MAAVGTAMFRPGGSFDPSCYATQRIYDNAETTRPKKWSSKLKLSSSGSNKSSEKSPENPYLYGTISAPGGSALSKSMKYAETWLYGSVRTQASPMRPSLFSAYPEVPGPILISTPQKPTPHNYAVILCSCPEYLNGTKKSSSTKVSICKKCKGSRLPLTIAESPRMLIGGTVRGPPVPRDPGILRTGTVRVQNSKSRPSILKQNGETDPYDMMRRNRLAPPQEARVGSQFSTSRSRARSISPCRIKNKKASPETLRKNRSKSVARVNNIWIEEDLTVTETKKSILSCDINPYDLVKTNDNAETLTEIDMSHGYCHNSYEIISKSVSKSKSDSNIKNNINLKIDECKTNYIEECSEYNPVRVSYDLKNNEMQTRELSTAISLPNINHENKKLSTVSRMGGKKSMSILTTNRPKPKNPSPKRPPRRTRNLKTDDESESDNQRLPEKNNNKKQFTFTNNLSSHTKSRNNNQDTIKSILKKPKNYEGLESTRAEQREESIVGRRLTTSQFYIPKPNEKGLRFSQNTLMQRKRVQFLVEREETKIIYTAEFDLQENTVRGIPGELEITENEIVAEGDIVSQSLNGIGLPKEESDGNSHLALDDKPYKDVQVNQDNQEILKPTVKEAEVLLNTTETGNFMTDNDVPKVSILRRSESERLSPPSLPVDPPKFLDTMALRPKTKHGHTSQVFLGSSERSNQIGHKTTNIFHLKSIDESNPVNNYDNSIDDSGNLSDSSEITKIVLCNLRRGISESPEPPPRVKSRDRSKARKNNYVKTRFVRNNSNSSTSDEWSDANEYEQKTILTIKHFYPDDTKGKNQSSPETNEYTTSDEPRKTSIQINGSECYATMNVSNDAPIYLSSVVVNDNPENQKNSCLSGNTVTISVSTPEKEVKKSKSQIYIESPSPVTDNLSSDLNNYEEYAPTTQASTIYESNIDDIMGDPVEAVKRNLVPHVCGKKESLDFHNENSDYNNASNPNQKVEKGNFEGKLFNDPFFGHLAEGLDSDLVKKLIENSLIKLQETKTQEGADNNMYIDNLIDCSLQNLRKDEKGNNIKLLQNDETCETITTNEIELSEKETTDDNNCSAPYESMEYESGIAGTFSDLEPMSDCYNASASELSTEDDTNSTRSKFYQMLVDAALCDMEIINNNDDDHLYETIRLNGDPIYEEISDMPPPLPINPPPTSLMLIDDDKRNGSRSIFEGASKYDILSYLVDAKERGIDNEDTYITSYVSDHDTSSILNEPKDKLANKDIIDKHLSSNTGHLSNASDSSEDNSLIIGHESLEKTLICKKTSAEIERNDSGVGSETSKSSRSRLQGKCSPCDLLNDKDSPIHLCEDCDTAVETHLTDQGSIFAPLVCRKCAKKRSERKEIITEIVETEEKYGRDLQIILEEFYKPMLVAGLLTQEQLSAIFLNVEELIENNQVLSEKLRDALEIALDQGDEDLLTVNVGKIILECSGMLTAFQSYCVKQAGAALLLAGLEKEKELLRIFLRVSQMENAVLRRMNLNSFLMVPVQRVTKYPLLLSRLYRATAGCAAERDDVKASQRCVESRLEEMNAAAAAAAAAARDVPLWRRLAVARRTAHDLHVADIRLRKMAVDVLDWNHEDARFAMEGKLLFTQPNDNNWRKGRTIKLTAINALLVTNGKPTTTHKTNEIRETREARDREARERDHEALFVRSGVREAALLLVREKAGRYTLQREPLFLDRCVVAADHEPEHFFEVHEITTKDSYIFKAEENNRTRTWYRQLQYHAQGSGAWRKRRNALANIMINPMLTRN